MKFHKISWPFEMHFFAFTTKNGVKNKKLDKIWHLFRQICIKYDRKN